MVFLVLFRLLEGVWVEFCLAAFGTCGGLRKGLSLDILWNLILETVKRRNYVLCDKGFELSRDFV